MLKIHFPWKLFSFARRIQHYFTRAAHALHCSRTLEAAKFAHFRKHNLKVNQIEERNDKRPSQSDWTIKHPHVSDYDNNS